MPLLSQNQALDIHRIILPGDADSYLEGARWCLKLVDIEQKLTTSHDAVEFLYGLYIMLLNQGQFTEAALLLWGIELFNPKPRSVQRIWEAIQTHGRVLIPGGSAQGKSFTPAAWAVLWWTQDPKYTSVKVISVTSAHATSNILATIKMFHQASVLPLPGRRMERFIDLGDGDKRASIEQVNLPVGEDVKARMRGFHPIPRPYHPLFGRKTRTGLIVDEGEDVSHGIWEGIDNFLSTDTEKGIHAKVISGTNPKKPESPFAQRCEFPGGWQNFDLETSETWYGPEALGKWLVVRIDPAKSENVVEKREVYPGLMTYEGYMNYLRKGSNSPEYYTFGRGAWPQSAAEFRITPPDYFYGSRGTLVFQSDVIPIASLDPALAEGGDNAVLTTARYGTALGFIPVNGEYIRWDFPHKAIQIEQQFNVPKDNTLVMAKSVMAVLRQLKVRPEWFIMDKSGVGWGLYDAIFLQFGQIQGQMWSDAASERKILEGETGTAEEKYKGVITEMAFAFALWLQNGYIKFAPMMDATKLASQAVNRKYNFAHSGLIIAESKLSYKATSLGVSPDEYDSAIMLPHLVRLRESEKPQMMPGPMQGTPLSYPSDLRRQRPNIIDRLEFFEPT